MNEPPFEFVKSLHGKGCDVLFLRDIERAWYQFGLGDNSSNDIDSLANILMREIIGYDYIITLGNSMGGYASILFGHLIGADLSIAIAPQTFIDEKQRDTYGDIRWNVLMRKFHHKVRNSPYYDLREYLKYKKSKTDFLIFYGSTDLLDSLHATRMERLDKFFIYEIRDADHVSAQKLRDYGIIDRLLDVIIKEKNTRAIIHMLENEIMLKKFNKSP